MLELNGCELLDNVICLGESFIASVSDSFVASPHKHPVIEIYCACDANSRVQSDGSIVQGQMIVIGHDALHAIRDNGKRGLVIFVDTLSECGYAIKENLLKGDRYCVVSNDEIKAKVSALCSEPREASVLAACGEIIETLRGKHIDRPFCEAVMQALELICDENEDFTMQSLADKVHLSKSRLAHLFSQHTGITLKSYLQFKRLEKAFRLVVKGSNITDAAYDTGFSGSALISSSGRKLTGMQLRKLLNL